MPPKSDPKWLLKPASDSEVKLHIDIGENAHFGPGFKAAVDNLLQEIFKQNLEHLKASGGTSAIMIGCPVFKIPKCNPLKTQPCYQLVSCRIGDP